ncbi:MAG: hypothetical protein ACNI27_07145 [Desulfovibrio sp.]
MADKTKNPEPEAELFPVEELAEELPRWEIAGLMRAAKWAEGKLVSKAEFESQLLKFRNRAQGG